MSNRLGKYEIKAIGYKKENGKSIPVSSVISRHNEYSHAHHYLIGHIGAEKIGIGAKSSFKKDNLVFQIVPVLGKKKPMKKLIREHIEGLDKKTFSPEIIAKKHNVSVEHINSQLKIGIKIEQEHTSDKDAAREIALDHLNERPDYYTRLKKVEENKVRIIKEIVKRARYRIKEDSEKPNISITNGDKEEANDEPTIVKGNTTLTGERADTININPQLPFSPFPKGAKPVIPSNTP